MAEVFSPTKLVFFAQDQVEIAPMAKLQLAPALPFDGAPVPIPATGVPALSLEQYASLRAECEVADEERIGPIHRRYGLADANAARALDESWQQRLLANPADQLRFDELLARFGLWLLPVSALRDTSSRGKLSHATLAHRAIDRAAPNQRLTRVR